LKNFCAPDTTALEQAAIKKFKEYFYENFHGDIFTEYISDLISVWYCMVISIGFAFVVGIIYMVFLRFCAGVIIFLSIIAIIVVIAGGGCWIYFIGRE